MPRKSIQDYVPAVKQNSVGFAFSTVLIDTPAAARTATATNLDKFKVPVSFVAKRNGAKLTITEFQVWFGDIACTGTPTTTTWKIILVKNGDATNGILGTASILYNATAGSVVSVDVRDASGKGVDLVEGDDLRFDISQVPSGGGASAISINRLRCRVVGQHYGLTA